MRKKKRKRKKECGGYIDPEGKLKDDKKRENE